MNIDELLAEVDLLLIAQQQARANWASLAAGDAASALADATPLLAAEVRRLSALADDIDHHLSTANRRARRWERAARGFYSALQGERHVIETLRAGIEEHRAALTAERETTRQLKLKLKYLAYKEGT